MITNLLKVMVSLSIISPAFLVEFSMAVILELCSEVAPSCHTIIILYSLLLPIPPTAHLHGVVDQAGEAVLHVRLHHIGVDRVVGSELLSGED